MNDIHKFKCNDEYFILDVSSGAIHVVDKIIYEIIDENGIESRINIINKYRGKYEENILNECYDEIEELIKKEQLYSEDKYEPIANNFEKEPDYIKAVCLNIAHDCNLRCKYCFADGEGYDQQKILISFDIAKKSIDFLIKNSGVRVNIEVDFFGGEPLLNMDVVKRTVDYARSKENHFVSPCLTDVIVVFIIIHFPLTLYCLYTFFTSNFSFFIIPNRLLRTSYYAFSTLNTIWMT